MTQKSEISAFAQLRDVYRRHAAAQLQMLMAARIQAQKQAVEEEAKYRAMWRYMLAEYKKKL